MLKKRNEKGFWVAVSCWIGNAVACPKATSWTCIRKILFLWMLWAGPFDCLCAEPLLKNPTKYKLSICAVFKNEERYLKEWIEYHRLAGVDHFFLYNNGSIDRFTDVLRPYIKTGVVTLIQWPDNISPFTENVFMWSLSTLISAYENAVKFKALNKTEWLVFLDIDEFLVFPDEKNLKTLLGKYNEFPGIKISSVSFDASSTLSVPGRRLLVETVELVKPTACHLHKMVIKTIFKPALSKGFTWPPYECLFENNQRPVELPKNELCINRYENRFKGLLFHGKSKDVLHVDNRILTEKESSELLDMGYEIEDQERTIFRFVPDLIKKMGFSQ